MEKIILEELVNQKLSTYEIANHLHLGTTTIRYWLKKYNLKSRYNEIHNGIYKKCPSCKEIKEKKYFYSRRNKTGGSVYCIPCSNQESANRHRIFKQKCLE